MAHYLVQVAYTSEAWANLVKKPQSRMEVVGVAIEKLGGRIEGAWLTFGEYDTIVITQMPDNVSAAALSIAFSAGGALRASKTTPLMTAEEGLEAMRKAAGAGYRPPGG